MAIKNTGSWESKEEEIMKQLKLPVRSTFQNKIGVGSVH